MVVRFDLVGPLASSVLVVGLCGIEGRHRERRRWLYGRPRVIDLRPGQPLCYLLDLLIWLVGLYEYVGTKSSHT